MNEFFITDMSSIFRILLVGIGAYISLIGVLRLNGKRTLSKDVPLVEGITAFALLAAMQFAVTWSSVRSNRFRKWIKAEPRVLLRDGEFDEAALLDKRVTLEEVVAAIRGYGLFIGFPDRYGHARDVWESMSAIPIRAPKEEA